jgi:superfamily II DNA or RNA helicase
MAVELSNYQLEAVDQLKNGSILCGGVGSGKSRTALAYYYFKVCEGNIKVNGKGKYIPMKKPRDLYIITPAKKRDSLEWNKECYDFVLCKDKPELSLSGVKVTIDSWNNIKKYKNVYGAFFIFDEQRLVGSGAWVKAFYNIARKNQWILLSATPGDQWTDYIPVFVANGFYKNKTEFKIRHCVYSRYTKYPKIERYVDEKTLKKYRDDLLVNMKDNRMTIRHNELVNVDYDKMKFRQVYVDRWDPYENRPIAETGKLYYLMRKVANSDESRIIKTAEIVNRKDRCIIFYNFSYELDLLRAMCEDLEIEYAEWNGKKHQDLPEGERWVYLVQYSAGCEGWNCITTDTIIFYSQSYSYRMTEQASGRIDRLNTPYTDLYYYHLRSSAWIDLAIYRSLKNKKNFNESSQKLKIKA